MRNRVKTFRKERGQVLILALIALLVLVLAIFILFDISSTSFGAPTSSKNP